MDNIVNKTTLIVASVIMMTLNTLAQQNTTNTDGHTGATHIETDGNTGATHTHQIRTIWSKLHIGGYGEAVMTRNMYSNHFNRYKYPEQHKNDDNHGQFDLPHVTINIGYLFGKGWTMGMEVEFEHGGTESAVEVDADESGEYEAETEKGGEVALEQMWIEKKWNDAIKLRVGEIVVPIGATNKHHTPTEFFTCYRPEGEANLFPCTWHQTGLAIHGRTKKWGYEGQFLAGLDSERFGSDCFIHYAATSCYEYKIANVYAGAFRIDNYSIDGLRLSISGYIGNSFKNKLRSAGSKYDNCKGTVKILAFDMKYDDHNVIIRGNADVATLSDAQLITTFNNSYPKHSGQDGSPSKHQPVGDKALTYGIEAGYNFFGISKKEILKDHKLILFGRYEYYNPMFEGTQKVAYEWTKKKRFALGVNYMPLAEIVVKAEYSKRILNKPFLDEPSVSMSVGYSF